jgi:2-polyprenyl-3-methyl-5-hydroxy-6-metoxy-1,4-benzoquinol methylase
MPRHAHHDAGLSPIRIIEDLWGAWKTRALVAGVELDVFTHIAAGKGTAEEIAFATDASERGIAFLLDALVGMGYLHKSGRRYRLRPLAAKYLVRGKERYLGRSAALLPVHWDSWGHLTEVVKSGQPYLAVDQVDRAREFFPKLVEAIFANNYFSARLAVRSLPQRVRRGIRRILDVGAGSAAWSIPFAQAIPGAHVTALDLPEVTPVTRQFAQRFGVASRYDYLEGNLRELEFGRGAYDLVILGHILHSEGRERGRQLLARCAAALRKGGLLLVAEMIPNDQRTGPLIPLLFGLNMLLQTEQGDVFTLREFRGWLRAVGLHSLRTIKIPAPSPLILATK